MILYHLRRWYVQAAPLTRRIWWGRSRYCPLCDSRLRGFHRFGDPPRSEALCPVCLSLERDRLLWTVLQDHVSWLREGKIRLLHIAPEPTIERRLRCAANIDYVSSDLAAGRAMLQMDITAIDCADSSFDGIMCNHVLEHVPDDLAAMRELFRVLRDDGLALITVPIGNIDATFEDSTIVDPRERKRRFGQFDHVRIYGSDVIDRLETVGFVVTQITGEEILSDAEMLNLGIRKGHDRVLLCRRPAKICEIRSIDAMRGQSC